MNISFPNGCKLQNKLRTADLRHMEMHPKTLQIFQNMERTAKTSKLAYISGFCEHGFFLCQSEADRACDNGQKKKISKMFANF